MDKVAQNHQLQILLHKADGFLQVTHSLDLRPAAAVAYLDFSVIFDMFSTVASSIFTVSTIGHWNNLHREAVDFPTPDS